MTKYKEQIDKINSQFDYIAQSVYNLSGNTFNIYKEIPDPPNCDNLSYAILADFRRNFNKITKEEISMVGKLKEKYKEQVKKILSDIDNLLYDLKKQQKPVKKRSKKKQAVTFAIIFGAVVLAFGGGYKIVEAINNNTTALKGNTAAVDKGTAATGENTVATEGNTAAVDKGTAATGENTAATEGNTAATGENTTAIKDNTTTIQKNNKPQTQQETKKPKQDSFQEGIDNLNKKVVSQKIPDLDLEREALKRIQND